MVVLALIHLRHLIQEEILHFLVVDPVLAAVFVAIILHLVLPVDHHTAKRNGLEQMKM